MRGDGEPEVLGGMARVRGTPAQGSSAILSPCLSPTPTPWDHKSQNSFFLEPFRIPEF